MFYFTCDRSLTGKKHNASGHNAFWWGIKTVSNRSSTSQEQQTAQPLRPVNNKQTLLTWTRCATLFLYALKLIISVINSWQSASYFFQRHCRHTNEPFISIIRTQRNETDIWQDDNCHLMKKADCSGNAWATISGNRHANGTSITSGADQTASRSAFDGRRSPQRGLLTSASASASAASFNQSPVRWHAHLLLITVNYSLRRAPTTSRPWNPTALHKRPSQPGSKEALRYITALHQQQCW